MSLVRRIARPLLAAPFVFERVRTALHPEREIDVYPQAFEAADSAIAKSSAPGFLDVRTIVVRADPGAPLELRGMADVDSTTLGSLDELPVLMRRLADG